MDFPHNVTIRWGTDDFNEEEPQEPVNYSFHTKEELDAFMTGVVEACGWPEFKIIDDSRENT